MDFILYAAETTAATAPKQVGASDFLSLLIPWAIIFVVFYFLLIRPQKKKANQHQNMISELKEGDAVITSGGIKGEIAAVTEEFFEVRIDKGVKITIKKGSIASKYEPK